MMEDTISIHKRKAGMHTIIIVEVGSMYGGSLLYRGTDIEKAKEAINKYYDKEIGYINLQRSEDIEKLINQHVEK